MRLLHITLSFLLLQFAQFYADDSSSKLFEKNMVEFLEQQIIDKTYCRYPIESSSVIFPNGAPVDDTYITIGGGEDIFYECDPEQIILPFDDAPSKTLVEAEITNGSKDVGIPNKVLFEFTKRPLDKALKDGSLNTLKTRYKNYIEKRIKGVDERFRALEDFYGRAKCTSPVASINGRLSSEVITKCRKIIKEGDSYRIVEPSDQSATSERTTNELCQQDWDDKLGMISASLSNLSNLYSSYSQAAGFISKIWPKNYSQSEVLDKDYLLQDEVFHTIFPANVKVSKAINGRCKHGLLRKYTSSNGEIAPLCLGGNVNGTPITEYNVLYEDAARLKPIITKQDLMKRKVYSAPCGPFDYLSNLIYRFSPQLPFGVSTRQCNKRSLFETSQVLTAAKGVFEDACCAALIISASVAIFVCSIYLSDLMDDRISAAQRPTKTEEAATNNSALEKPRVDETLPEISNTEYPRILSEMEDAECQSTLPDDATLSEIGYDMELPYSLYMEEETI